MKDQVYRHLAAGAVVLVMLLSGCAGHREAVKASAPPGQKVKLEMKADNFNFDPAEINVQKGSILVLEVRNVTGTGHNITVKDPSGNIMKSEDIPGNQSVTTEIFLSTAGVYPFYCDKPFHPTLGMKGRIVAK